MLAIEESVNPFRMSFLRFMYAVWVSYLSSSYAQKLFLYLFCITTDTFGALGCCSSMKPPVFLCIFYVFIFTVSALGQDVPKLLALFENPIDNRTELLFQDFVQKYRKNYRIGTAEYESRLDNFRVSYRFSFYPPSFRFRSF